MSNTNLTTTSGQAAPNVLTNAVSLFGARNAAMTATHYSARVSSANPCAFLILIDQSGSMEEELKDNRGVIKTKAEHLALMVNQFLEETILTCQKTDLIKDYFELLIIGYGRIKEDDGNVVEIAWKGSLANRTWVTVNELRNGSIRKEVISVPNPKPFGPREMKEEVNIWVEPYAEGLTPMKKAFDISCTYLQEWVKAHPESFPPMVFNITDGVATDISTYSELVEASDRIKSISTDDGDTLLFNLLLSENSENLNEYPLLSERNSFEGNKYEAALFDASSSIPDSLKKFVSKKKPNEEEIKGVVFGNFQSVISFLNIGTSTLKNRIS
ncbi:hypothetical protein FHS57_001652 [Runella defluvii]|uniref:VWA domain-containing protein n=1 Tax=Runella defluvii TaxID=370973 RepID=A0A7W5ZJA2_9BACT|nr:hypothetical protein [Runella defluvii]MBB3837655.1 hypothetical protein [Runella defluvii]